MSAVDVAERLADHMTRHFPDDTEVGGWVAARDTRDGTAALVWQGQGATLVTKAVRGQVLGQWLQHLQAAGFEAEPRTDRSVFVDDGTIPDGYAYWLHVTGWSAPPADAERVE